MNYDYNYGNKYFNYYGKKGVESIIYDIIAPEQEQKRQPGFEYVMKPLPIFDDENYKGSGRLKDKVAIITGGDSELGSTFVFLASNDSSYLTGQVIHNNGGQVMG